MAPQAFLNPIHTFQPQTLTPASFLPQYQNFLAIRTQNQQQRFFFANINLFKSKAANRSSSGIFMTDSPETQPEKPSLLKKPPPAFKKPSTTPSGSTLPVRQVQAYRKEAEEFDMDLGEDESLLQHSEENLGDSPVLPADKRIVKKPKSAANLRTQSQRRRLSPVHKVSKKKYDDGSPDTNPMEFDPSDKIEVVPLVRKKIDPRSGEDYWLDPAAIAPKRSKNKKKNINPEQRAKLRKEVASPYKNNWILYVILFVAVMVFLYSVLPNEAPIIKIPDL